MVEFLISLIKTEEAEIMGVTCLKLSKREARFSGTSLSESQDLKLLLTRISPSVVGPMVLLPRVEEGASLIHSSKYQYKSQPS